MAIHCGAVFVFCPVRCLIVVSSIVVTSMRKRELFAWSSLVLACVLPVMVCLFFLLVSSVHYENMPIQIIIKFHHHKKKKKKKKKKKIR